MPKKKSSPKKAVTKKTVTQRTQTKFVRIDNNSRLYFLILILFCVLVYAFFQIVY